MEKISFTGGSMVGWMNASWPLAKLTVSSDRILLSSFGKYEFTPEQVVSIEPFGAIPVLASGIRINHNRPDYPGQIVFWCVGGRKKVLASLDNFGFHPQGIAGQRPSGFAFRWSAILAFLVIWNALFLFGMSSHNDLHDGPGPLELIALLSVFVFSTALQKSAALQKFTLQDGHHIGEIKHFLQFVQLLTGVLFLGFGITYFLGR
ncbi:MAG: hypothetical protein WBD81_21745 [Collimonas pratensis]|uniref:hypothetical protein n=1 Tax=Collimonas pratensis TaxID=279113 RepID=UPI003C720A5F